LKVKNLILSTLCLLNTLSLLAQGQAPLSFIENKGQWDASVRFRADVGNGALFVHNSGFTVLQHNNEDLVRIQSMMHNGEASEKAMAGQVLHSHAYRVDFVGARNGSGLLPDKVQPGISNYFIGNDPAHWGSSCRTFNGITVPNIYPNIDLRYYSENGQLKYDLIVHPGGDPGQIALRYSGTDGIAVREKALEVKTSVGTIRELPPYAYQYTDKGREQVTCQYKVSDSTLRFGVKNYDTKSMLVIDPTIIFASLSGSTASNWGFTATYGPDGSLFGGGIVFGQGFPTSPGAFMTDFHGGSWDIGIIKLSPSGSQRVYATYIGGSGDEQPHSLWCDSQGFLVITGRTNSGASNPNTAFPANATFGPQGGNDLFVTKLNPTGSAIIGSIRVGGSAEDGVNISAVRARSSLQFNYGDDGRSEVIEDPGGNIYVAACTRSDNFYTTNAFQSTFGGSQDGVVIKIDPSLSTVLFSSFLGGSGDDAAYVLALSPINGNLYIAGGTASGNFPTTSGVLSPGNNGQIDGFVTAVANNGGSILRSTCVGTGAYDQIYGIQFDRLGYPYITGQTLGSWPIINAQYSVPNARQFISKLEPDLSNYVYSTTFGTANASLPNISPTAFLVDRCENVYVSGWGGNGLGNFTFAGTLGLPVTADAINNPPYNSPQQTDGKDFYFFVLKKNATSQLFGSFFGENAAAGVPDHVDGGTSRFDANGVIYQAMCANCTNPKPAWPATPGAWAERNGSNGCNLGMIKVAFNLAGLSAGVQSAIGGVPRDTAGCLPLTVDFRDTIANAVSYEWDLNGDGVNDLTTTTPNAQFTYNAVGTYHVRLIAVDPNSCNLRDTSYVNIRVGVLEAKPDFSFRKLNPCDSLKYEFTITTPNPTQRPFRNNSFVWEFPDENLTFTSGPGTFTHSFPRPGPFRVRLRLVDTAYCNAPETKDTIVNVAVLVKASFNTPAHGCAPYSASFVNTTAGGQSFFWDFGNGQTSTDPNPGPQFYPNPGPYTIRLTVVDSGTCNIIDSTSFSIIVDDKPRAGIGSISPQPPTPNTAITFQNTSSPDAVSFVWLFGDGDTQATNNMLPVSHEFNTTDSFLVKLVAFNRAGCPDTTARWIATLVEPAIDVPNAFLPLSGGPNAVVHARGFGIASMRFSIWNRWGQKVFETNDRKIGWDGTWQGKLQPMDVYAYTLEVTFVDGRKATRKGDITLIR
jgi:gliding motility-associated-like protein